HVPSSPHRGGFLLPQHRLDGALPPDGGAGARCSAGDGLVQLPAVSGRPLLDVLVFMPRLLLPHAVENLVLRPGLRRSLSGIYVLPKLLRDADRPAEPLGDPMITQAEAPPEIQFRRYPSQWAIFFLVVGAALWSWWAPTQVHRAR